MDIQPKIVGAFQAYATDVSGAANAGVAQNYITVMAKISSLANEAQQKAQRFDAATHALFPVSARTPAQQIDAEWNELQAAYDDYNAYLKRFRGILKQAVAKGDALPHNYKQHYLRPMDILLKELDGASNGMKIELKGNEAKVKKARGQIEGGAQEMRRIVEDLHLRIRKGCDDAEASFKKYLLKPSEQTFMAAYSSGNGLRTCYTSHQMLLHIGKTHGKEQWYFKLMKMYALMKPDTIKELSSQHNANYWAAEFSKGTRGGGGDWWNTQAARTHATTIMKKEIPRWRQFSADIKREFYKP